MLNDTTARLIEVRYTGLLGTMTRTETETPIFCQLGSVNRTEYFSAYNSGLKPELLVVTNPVNYAGQGIIEVDTPDGAVRCDIYRTYRAGPDKLELWCVKKNDAAEQAFTLWDADGRRVTLYGAYLTGTDGTDRTETGRVATDTVSLVLPQTLRAFIGETPVAYCRPKAFAAMNPADRLTHFYIDSRCFFAAGILTDAGKYQAVNAAYDDVWLVQSVAVRNRGTPDTEYIEVTGK